MAEPYSIELRERVVRTYETGEGSYREVAERFAVGEATVKRWVSLMRKRGTVGPERKGGGTPSSITLADVERLLVMLKDPTAGLRVSLLLASTEAGGVALVFTCPA
jgi:transposase